MILKEIPIEEIFEAKPTNIGDDVYEKANIAQQRSLEDAANLLIEDAIIKAQTILKDSEEKAQQIVGNAKKNQEAIEKDAFNKGYNKGFEEGFSKGHQEGQAKWENSLKQFNILRKELQNKNAVFRDYLQKESIKLAVHIAEKVLQDEIKNDKIFLKLIKTALDSISEEKDVIIRICPEDFDRVSEIRQLKEYESLNTKTSIVKDPNLKPGDCIIESNAFKLDAGIATQIGYIYETLKEMDVIQDD